jgi:hypothetical protein
MISFALQTIEELLALPWGDARIDAMFAWLGVRRTPKLEEEKVMAWIPVNKAGIEFGFEDEAYFEAQPISRRGRGKLLLTNIILYAEREDMEQYGGPLPCGLEFGERREAVSAKLAPYARTLRAYVRDVYELLTYRLILSYRGPEQGLADVVLTKVRASWPEQPGPQPPLPTLEAIRAALGQNLAGRQFVGAFGAFDLRARTDELTVERSISFREEFGFVLYFRESKRLTLPQKQPGLVLGAVRFHRERDVDARQWRGELPFGLDFDDSPTVIFEKVPVPPATQRDKFLTGEALWKFPDWELHVLYSTYENCIFRVSVMAPGYWESFETDAGQDDSR